MRLSKTDYYLNLAREVATRSTCLRTAYGAVIARDDKILSTGYNGAARGLPNCIDVGKCAREHVESRTRYELCKAVHAEINAIINAETNVIGSTIYIAGFDVQTKEPRLAMKCYPCVMCYRQMVNARIKDVCINMQDGEHWQVPLSYFLFLEEPCKQETK